MNELWEKIIKYPQPHSPDGKCYRCAVCQEDFEQFEMPLFLEDGYVVHIKCWINDNGNQEISPSVEIPAPDPLVVGKND